MRMLSGRFHGLLMGLALLVSAHGLHSHVYGQMPGQMPGAMPAGGMMNIDAPMSMAFPGPAPGGVVPAGHHSSASACDGGCGGCGDLNCCGSCGIGSCCIGGDGPLARLLRGGGTCPGCGGMGCGACGGCGIGNGCLFSGRLAGLLGVLAPYSEGGRATPRWFDFYAGTIGLRRTGNLGGFQGREQGVMGNFLPTTIVSRNGQGLAAPVALRTTDLDLDSMEWGLELIAALQVGPGANLEARYFGLNGWEDTATANVVASGTPTLFSAFSLFGTSPPGGFDDVDRSFIHTLTYQSEIHSGEVNYRRRFATVANWLQGSWLAGVRYFDLDEMMRFSATGSQNNTFQFDQLRFANIDVHTRNQMTGFQMGGDLWVNLLPGVKWGVEGKSGIYGNHHEVAHSLVANSIAGANEFLQGGQTAYLSEFSTSLLYRLNYSWTAKFSYNLLYVDNVALAAENLNARGFAPNAFGSAAFGADRQPTINVDSEVFYQGFSFGAEYTW